MTVIVSMPRENWPPEYIPDELDDNLCALWKRTDKLIIDVCRAFLPDSICEDVLSENKVPTEDNGHILYIDYSTENVNLMIRKLVELKHKVPFFNITVIFNDLDNSSIYICDSYVSLMIDFIQFPDIYQKFKSEFENYISESQISGYYICRNYE